ncbi:hypothetical protein D3C85_1388960 [compost metagenome]
MHGRVAEQLQDGARQGGNGIREARQVAADAGFFGAAGVIVAVPAIRDDYRRQAEVEGFAEAVVAAVMNEQLAFA